MEKSEGVLSTLADHLLGFPNSSEVEVCRKGCSNLPSNHFGILKLVENLTESNVRVHIKISEDDISIAEHDNWYVLFPVIRSKEVIDGPIFLPLETHLAISTLGEAPTEVADETGMTHDFRICGKMREALNLRICASD